MLPNQQLRGAFAACVLMTTANAYADNAKPLTPPPGCEPEPTSCPQAEPPVPQPMPAPPPAEEPTTPPWYDTAGWAVSAGGGADAFVSGGAENVTNIGGGWNVRLTMGTKWWVGAEAAYIGSAQGVKDVLGLQNQATLIGNGLQANARFNMTRNYFVQPFVYSGLAWRHYNLTGSDFATADVADSANVVELPLGFGVAGYWRNLILDARVDYRWAWGDRIVAVGDEDQARWNAMGNIGIAFR